MPLNQNNKALPPLVAVYMVAYNCEKYIAQAIEGVMMQETGFPYRLFIGDDCSTDNTAAICKEYRAKYPDKIELILQPVNKGAVNNAKDVYEACFASGAAYIAMCEGDDYWTDKTKLQQQADILEADASLSLCFHNAEILTESTGELQSYRHYDKNIFDIADAINLGAFVSTVSIFFRTKGLQFPSWYFRVSLGDCSLLLINALNGKFCLLDKTMAVYRKHPMGMSAALEDRQDQMIYSYLELLAHFNIHTGYGYNELIKKAGVKRLHDARTIVNYKNTGDQRPFHKKVFSKTFWQRKLSGLAS